MSLIKRICPHCGIALQDHPERVSRRMFAALKSYGDISQVRILNEAGCEHCSEGSIGRFAVAEVIVCDEALMADLVQSSQLARKNYRARPDSDASTIDQAVAHVLAGRACPINVEDKIDHIPSKEVR